MTILSALLNILTQLWKSEPSFSDANVLCRRPWNNTTLWDYLMWAS